MKDSDETGAAPLGADEARRGFLAACGRFAAITPPAVTMLLSTSLTSPAIAKSGGRPPKGRNSDGIEGPKHGGPGGKHAHQGGGKPGAGRSAGGRSGGGRSGGGPKGRGKGR